MALLASVDPQIGFPALAINLGLWIWNIIDAYLMNRDALAAEPSIAQQETLTALLRLAEENQLMTSPSGLGLNHRLMSF